MIDWVVKKAKILDPQKGQPSQRYKYIIHLFTNSHPLTIITLSWHKSVNMANYKETNHKKHKITSFFTFKQLGRNTFIYLYIISLGIYDGDLKNKKKRCIWFNQISSNKQDRWVCRRCSGRPWVQGRCFCGNGCHSRCRCCTFLLSGMVRLLHPFLCFM